FESHYSFEDENILVVDDAEEVVVTDSADLHESFTVTAKVLPTAGVASDMLAVLISLLLYSAYRYRGGLRV
ncbi:hypothetical protein HON22_04015, partial [Candidatus Peregrinibacteria bacterium]|nr:hypothetical protein [Candidatus Peregrinibacteria bacterium]